MKNMDKIFGKASLIFGSISLPANIAFATFFSVIGGQISFSGTILAFVPVISFLLSIIAIIYGIISYINDDSKKDALSGVILGGIGIIVGLLTFYLFTTL
ncbi:hypothetical protein LCGC14_1756680 [marine sediment metagenome]|uniref:Uncharacterized protein n=1 Tax=marine sediment metagenome TaxID=412755 RepID=A0A0F9H2A3_9ZZZZ